MMKSLILLGLLLLSQSNFYVSAVFSEEISIQIKVTLQRDTPAITLEWNYTHPADADTCVSDCVFDVFRCDDPFDPTPNCWGNPFYTADLIQGPGSYGCTDTNVQVG